MSVDENKELVDHRIKKARETLAEVSELIQIKLWNVAINRLYYACFYAVSALLADRKIYSKTHSGTKQMFGLHFVKPGIIDESSNTFYSNIFSLRQSGDYEDFCDYEQEDVLELIEPAKEFVGKIEASLYNK